MVIRTGCASLNDAREYLVCSRDALHKMLSEGTLRSSRIRGRRVLLWRDLLQFMGEDVPAESDDRVFNVTGASRWLTVSRDTTYAMLADGSLKSRRIGNRYRIAESALRELVAANAC